MRLASDILFALAAVWVAGAMFALSTWAAGYLTPRTEVESLIAAKRVVDAISYYAVALLFVVVGLVVRAW